MKRSWKKSRKHLLSTLMKSPQNLLMIARLCDSEVRAPCVNSSLHQHGFQKAIECHVELNGVYC